MTATRHYVIHCDYGGCRDWIRFDVTTVTEARKLARKREWRMKDGQDRCPLHKP